MFDISVVLARVPLLTLSVALCACGAPATPHWDSSFAPSMPGCAAGSTPCSPGPDAATLPSAPAASDAGSAQTPDTSAAPHAAFDAGPAASDAATQGVDAAAAIEASVSTADAAQVDATPPASEAGAPFPPVSDVNAKGPYSPMTVNSTGPSGSFTIFRPTELAPGGVLTPILSWGNGGFTTPDLYPQLPHLASHGFLVIASNNPFVGGSDVRAGVDWIVQQNDNASSPYYKKLDLKRIAGVGYSNGGLAQLETADDPRYLTVVIISGANLNDDMRTENMPKLHTPVAYLCTDDDASEGNCAADFGVVKQPAFFGVMKGSAHTDVTTALGLGSDAMIARVGAATTAWLRWQVMGDTSFGSWFVGSACGLCKDANWTVQQKGL